MKSVLAFLAFFVSYSCNLSSAQTQFWKQTSGPFGDGCYVAAFDSNGNVFAGNDNNSSDGGLYRSTDNGTSWTHIGLLHTYVFALTVDPSGSVYAGTGSAGIFKSTNQGSTWTQVNNGLTSLDVRSIVVRPQGDLFAATRGSGVFYSSNGGIQWLSRSDGLPNSTIGTPTLSVNSLGTLFATTDNSGVFKSTNAGADWSQSSNGITNLWTTVVVVDPGDILFVATQGGVYRSTNSGDTWSQVNTGLSSTLVWALTTNQSGTVFCGLLNAEVYRSKNHGGTWELVGDFGTASSRFLAVNGSGHIFLTNDKGIFRSTDNGNQWMQCGLPNSGILAVGTHSNGRVYACVSNDVPYFTTDAGSTWTRSSAPGYAVSAFAVNSRDMIFMASNYLDRSTDGGNTWTRVGTGLPTFRILSLIANNQDILYAGLETVVSPPGYAGGGIYRSTDDGTTWALIGFDRQRVQSITANADGNVFAVVYSNGLHRSTDGGLTWTQLPQLTSSTQSILSIGGNSILAGTFNNGIFRSTDNGTTWSQVVQNGTTVNSFAYHWEGKVLAAADTNGVLLSTDNGLTWSAVVSGLENRKTNCITFNTTGYGYAGTIGGGVFSTSNRITSVRDGNKEQVDSYFLGQNYPNPWNPSTTIRYGLLHSSFVSLTVFNILGQQVTQLVNQLQQPGYHEVTFGIDNMSSGVYFYRIHAGSFIEVRKMLLLR